MSQIQLVQEMDARLVEFNRPAMALLVGIKNLFEHFGRRPLDDDDEKGFKALLFEIATDRWCQDYSHNWFWMRFFFLVWIFAQLVFFLFYFCPILFSLTTTYSTFVQTLLLDASDIGQTQGPNIRMPMTLVDHQNNVTNRQSLSTEANGRPFGKDAMIKSGLKSVSIWYF